MKQSGNSTVKQVRFGADSNMPSAIEPRKTLQVKFKDNNDSELKLRELFNQHNRYDFRYSPPPYNRNR